MRKHLVDKVQDLGFSVDDSQPRNLIATRGDVTATHKAPMITTHMDTFRRDNMENPRFGPIPLDVTLESLIHASPPARHQFADGAIKNSKFLDEGLKWYTKRENHHYAWLENMYLGHDDKDGIAIALHVAKNTDIPLCLVFTHGEVLCS